jgi:hypothetical protein
MDIYDFYGIAFCVSLLMVCAAVAVKPAVTRGLNHMRQRLLRRRLRALMRRPIARPWNGAVVGNWGRTANHNAEALGLRFK